MRHRHLRKALRWRRPVSGSNNMLASRHNKCKPSKLSSGKLNSGHNNSKLSSAPSSRHNNKPYSGLNHSRRSNGKVLRIRNK